MNNENFNDNDVKLEKETSKLADTEPNEEVITKSEVKIEKTTKTTKTKNSTTKKAKNKKAAEVGSEVESTNAFDKLEARRKEIRQERRQFFRVSFVDPIHNRIVKPVNDNVLKPTKKAVVDPITDTVIRPINDTVINPTKKAVVDPIYKPIHNKIIKPFAKTIDKHIIDRTVETVNRGIDYTYWLTKLGIDSSVLATKKILVVSKNGVLVTKNTVTFNRVQKKVSESDSKRMQAAWSWLYKFTVGGLAGVCSIIPGLSGATVFSATGTWTMVNDSISSMTKFRSNPTKFKNSLSFLIPMSVGMGLGYLGFAFFYEFLTSPSIMNAVPSMDVFFYIFFAFIVAFTTISVYRRTDIKITKERAIYFVIFFLLIFSLGVISLCTHTDGAQWFESLSKGYEWLLAFGLGIIMFSTMIIPGVSGSLMLLVLGMYDWCIGKVTSFDIAFIGFFVLGGLLGILITAKFLERVTEKYPENTFYSIFGTMNASFVVVLMTTPWIGATHWTAAIMIPLAIVLAASFSYLLSHLNKSG